MWFADIVGYTRLSSQNETAALRLIEILQSAARRHTEAFSGEIVKFMGDGVLAEFGSTEAAARSANALQREFATRSAAAGVATTLRIGVHVGDVATASDGDIYGDGVNTASRLQGAAEPGQVLVSDDIWRQLHRRPAFTFESAGVRELPGLTDPLAVFALEEVADEGDDHAGYASLGSRGRFRRVRMRTALLAGGVVALLVGVGAAGIAGGWLPGFADGSPTPLEAAAIDDPRPSVAVLPLRDLSGDSADDYFSDGVTEDILTNLYKIGALRVISRASSAAYTNGDKPRAEIAQELGVQTLLEGSVQRAGDRVRINARLIDPRTEEPLWAETYERRTTDIFAIQSDIATRIAAALRAELTPAEQERVAAAPTANLTAYDFYLKGRDYANDFRDRQNVYSAIALFKQALAVDPDFSRAHAGLSHAYRIRSWYDGPAWVDSAIIASNRAIRLDPQRASGWVSLGRAYKGDGASGHYPRLREALRALTRAAELAPNDAEALAALSDVLKDQGRYDEALLRARQAVAVEPTSANANARVGRVYLEMGDLSRGEGWIRQALRLEPDGVLANIVLAQLQARRGEYRQATSTIEALLRRGGTWLHEWAGYFELLDGDARAAAEHFREAVRGAPPTQPERVIAATAYLRSGDEPAARRVLEDVEASARAATRRGTGPQPYLDLAGVAALRGQRERALELLRKAVEQGYRDAWALAHDPALEGLRSDPRFRRLLADLQTQLDRMRTRALRGQG